VDNPTGALFSSPLRGTQSVGFHATDEGGGVYQTALVVDGVEQPRQPLDANGGECRPPFVHPVPCKTDIQGTLALDSTTLDDGTHNLSLVVYDATGSNRVTFGPVAVEVDNVPEPTQAAGTGPPAGASTQTAAPARILGTGRFARKSIRQPATRSAVARGRVVDSSGRPLAGATLSVFAQAVGSNEQLLGTARTADDGTFSFVVPKGPSRTITVRYAGRDVSSAAWKFRLVVPAPLRLDASRHKLKNGGRLVLTAYLAGTRVPARSAAVAFQVLIGHQWRTFATRNIGADGKARIGHRFRVTYQRLTYRFRAVIVGRKAFPFANANSRAVAVQVN
jgi:hypothetical protein